MMLAQVINRSGRFPLLCLLSLDSTISPITIRPAKRLRRRTGKKTKGMKRMRFDNNIEITKVVVVEFLFRKIAYSMMNVDMKYIPTTSVVCPTKVSDICKKALPRPVTTNEKA